MPASERSIQITDRYQQALARAQVQAGAVARGRWGQLDPMDLRGSFGSWLAQAAPAISAAQRAAATLSSAYLAAYTTSETGEQIPPVPVNGAEYAGETPAGVTVSHALTGTLYGMLVRIKDRDRSVPVSTTTSLALTWGLARVTRLAAESASHAARSSLSDLLASEPDRYEGWRRIVRPNGCIACLAAANCKIEPLDAPFQLHPHCSCVEQPVIRGVPERITQATGTQIFHSLSESEQAALTSADAAKAVRDGHMTFSDLLKVNRMDAQPDQIQARTVH